VITFFQLAGGNGACGIATLGPRWRAGADTGIIRAIETPRATRLKRPLRTKESQA
jgi:hypothetical protein